MGVIGIGVLKSRMGEREFVEVAKQRCRFVINNIERLPDSTNITLSCKRTLLKLALSELNFLSRCSSSILNPSVNIGHLEAVIHILQQPFVTGVSRVCKPLPLSPATRNGKKNNSCSNSVHVDIVCTLNRKPVWIVVSDRNPKYVSWQGCHKSKGLKLRIEQVLTAARSSMMLKPSSIILFFSNGLGNFVHQKLQDEYGASEFGLEFSDFDFNFSEESEGDWINVIARSYREACVLEIKIDHISDAVLSSECGVRDSLLGAARPELPEEHKKMNLSDAFCSLISGMKICSDVRKLESAKLGDLLGEGDLINFDTTALIALVSGISNGGTEKLLAAPESELRQRFKGNFEFVIAQVKSEIQNPIHAELGGLISGKRGIICETVRSEFMELVLMCGGPNEKLRADQLLKCLTVVPDSPSERMMGLPKTRKLALKNKIVFGTGDYWHAPTVTANMAFVRAISQTGMSLCTIEHRPRALTGD